MTAARRASAALLVVLAAGALAQDRPDPTGKFAPGNVPRTMNEEEARASIDRAVSYLTSKQGADGAWGTSTVESLFELNYSPASFYAWKQAGAALCAMALMAVDETPERRAALEKAVSFVAEGQIPKRGNDWDIDNNWTNLYAYQAMVAAARDSRFEGADWKKKIEERGIEYYRRLETQQDPFGGWGYYEGPVVSRRPTWSTSFATACVIPALIEGKEKLGWPVDQKVIDRAVKYVARCRLPNGAYEYDLNPIPRIRGGEEINSPKGSLGRIQVGNWALRRAGDASITDDVIRAGLEKFFRMHQFLDAARQKPIPHESYYANAGYFYLFGHYYAALAINLLPEAERAALHERLRPHLVKVQWADGSSMDFVGSTYCWTASTSFSILALQAGLPAKTPR